MSIMLGIDVSAYQTVAYTTAAKHVGFVIVKCTEGKGGPSSAWSKHWTGTKSAGMLRGSYHLAHPSNNAPTVEAANYASVLARSGFVTGFDLPPVLDIEPSHGLSKAALTVWARAFMAAVDDKLGLAKLGAWRRCGVYIGDSAPNCDRAAITSGRWYWRGTYSTTAATIARTLTVPAGCSIAQWVTPASQVPGVTGSALDRDVARLEDLHRMAPVYFPKPDPVPDPPAPQPPIGDDMIGPARLVHVQRADGTHDPAVYAVTLHGAVHVKNPNHLSQLVAARWVEVDAAGKPVIHPISQNVLDDLLEQEVSK